jgi:hypothetical protein
MSLRDEDCVEAVDRCRGSWLQDQFCRDRRLEIGKGENEPRSEREDLRNIS